MINRMWNATLITEKFPSPGKEGDFNIQFINRPGLLVFDKITPDNIEFCDILYYDGTMFTWSTKNAASTTPSATSPLNSVFRQKEYSSISATNSNISTRSKPPQNGEKKRRSMSKKDGRTNLSLRWIESIVQKPARKKYCFLPCLSRYSAHAAKHKNQSRKIPFKYC